MGDLNSFLQSLSNDALPHSAIAGWWDLGDSILEPLRQLLESGSSDERRNAADLIRQMWFHGKFHEWILANAVEPMVHNLQDTNPLTRGYTAAILADIRDQRAFEPMLALTRDSNDYVRWVAAWALGRFNDTRAIPYLEWIRDHDSTWQIVHGQEDDYKQMNRDVAIQTITKLRASQ